METTILAAENPGSLEFAQQLLLEDRLVAFPTDTVYGVGVLAFHSGAIDQLYVVKGRDTAKAIAILLGDIHALGQVTVSMGSLAERLAKRFWPGPLTLVVSRHPDLPSNLSPLPTIGVRMPDHPVALELLKRYRSAGGHFSQPIRRIERHHRAASFRPAQWAHPLDPGWRPDPRWTAIHGCRLHRRSAGHLAPRTRNAGPIAGGSGLSQFAL